MPEDLGYVTLPRPIELSRSPVTADCGPESLGAVLNYWDRPITVEEISDLIQVRGRQGIFSPDLAILARREGLQTRFLTGAVEHLRRALREGVPPIVMVGTDDGGGHFFVVSAYSDSDRAVICEDYGGKKRRIDYETLEEKWDAGGRFLLLLKPTTAEMDSRAAADLEAEGHYAEAETLYRRALKEDPDRHVARVGLGNCLLRRGKLEEALAEYVRAREQVPGDPRLANNVAHVMLELGRDTAEAARLAGEAVDHLRSEYERMRRAMEQATNPAERAARSLDARDAGLDLALALGTLGRAREAEGRLPLAISAWKASYDHLPLDRKDLRARRLFQVGRCCLGLGMPNEARVNLAKALKLAEDPELAREIRAVLDPPDR